MANVAEPLLPDTRQRLIEAAWDAFRKEGYRVSIDRIAACAQVARQTVYNHFESKDVLFIEVIRYASRAILITLAGANDIRGTLIAFGDAYREKLLNADGIAIFRMLTAESAHFPALAEQFFLEGPCATRQRLAGYLANAMEAGRMRRDNPEFAAEMLTAMLVDYDRMRCLMTLELNQLKPEKTSQVVDCFLRAFAPDNAPENAPEKEKP